MDPTALLPKAPATDEPTTWIAMLLVVVVVSVLVWQLKAASTERTEAAKSRDEALNAFRAELAAQRVHDAAQTHETHERITGLSIEVRRLAERSA